MFVDLDWPLNASSLLSASAELLAQKKKKKKGALHQSAQYRNMSLGGNTMRRFSKNEIKLTKTEKVLLRAQLRPFRIHLKEKWHRNVLRRTLWMWTPMENFLVRVRISSVNIYITPAYCTWMQSSGLFKYSIIYCTNLYIHCILALWDSTHRNEDQK